MEPVVIVSAVRTPVGRYLGALKTVEAFDLGALVLQAAVDRIGLDPALVDEVVMGQAYQSGEYVNIARMSLLTADWPDTIPGLTLDRRCCTGLEALRYAAMLVQTGQAQIVAAGGVESMSNGEFYLPGKIKWGIGGEKNMPRGHGDMALWGTILYDRLQRARVMSQPESRYGLLASMMSWAETAAEEENISRAECDKWALGSHRKACAAMEAGKFDDEMVTVTVPGRKGPDLIVDRDENPRPDTSLEKLNRLKPVMGGVCTAGNSSSENDGAAAMVVMSPKKAAALGLETYAAVKSVTVVGCDPRKTHKTVPAAAAEALAAAGITMADLDLIEIQEAFAAQVLADLKEMNIGPDKYDRVNVNGSGISLGHPIAATGVRVLVSLVHEMKRRRARRALASICGGGGLGMATILER